MSHQLKVTFVTEFELLIAKMAKCQQLVFTKSALYYSPNFCQVVEMVELAVIHFYSDDVVLMTKDKSIMMFCLMILYFDMKYPAIL